MSNNQHYQPPQGPPPSHNQGYNQGYSDNQQSQYQPPSYPPRPQGNTNSASHSNNPFNNPASNTSQQGSDDPSSGFVPPSDRAEQIETLQSYEGSGHHNEDDSNREQLQREFPNVDGSLIAALYGDSGSMAATREVLMELASAEQSGQGQGGR